MDPVAASQAPREDTVHSALFSGLSEADVEFVTEALHKAQQATKEADDRGEAPPQPIW
ncbi:hypothetical protein acdb102_19260 [Acidothermaceae bacterium B102]|nr:hypothetical protein acdb102_19260 [Acidothermaceae bacterium B102]